MAWSPTGVSRTRLADDGAVLRIEPSAQLTIDLAVTPPAPSTAPILSAAAGMSILMMTALEVKGPKLSQHGTRRLDRTRWRFDNVYPGRIELIAIGYSPLGDSVLLRTPLDLKPGDNGSVGLSFDLRGVVVDVVVRAERGQIPTAQVLLLSGHLPRLPRLLRDLNDTWRDPRRHLISAVPVGASNRTDAGAALYRDNDLHGIMTAVTPGPHTACVIPLAGDLRDASYMRTLDGKEDLEVRCTAIDITDAPIQALVLEAPPMRNPATAPAPR